LVSLDFCWAYRFAFAVSRHPCHDGGRPIQALSHSNSFFRITADLILFFLATLGNTSARRDSRTRSTERGLNIVGTYVENESGAKLARPELFRLLADSKPGNVLLVEQVDRLSRLTDSDWRKLRAELDAKQVRVVALDLPTSWQLRRRATSSLPACSHNAGIAGMLRSGMSWTSIQAATGCSRATIAKVAKRAA
jgi:hypothetical protein